MRFRTIAALAIVAATGLPALPASAAGFDPAVEASNYAKTLERQSIYDTAQYQAELTAVQTQNELAATTAQLADPERVFTADLCSSGTNGCAGDVRLYDWQAKGFGVVTPVLFTARSGATISGHIWATRAGPAKRPGIVITNGSVQAVESFYWFAAQALAKAGYVVMTFDPQGQGQSDTPGAGADATEGVPAQTDGRPFYDGTEDAIDFFLSTKDKPYVPVPSCSSGTSHADKQADRVKRGLDTAFNPYWSTLDASRLGIAGHSYGAGGVSYVGQSDPRVKAIVAWDNLGAPDPSREGSCVDPKARAIPPITKPALGMSADYFLPPEPNTSLPDPLAKSTESVAYTQAGVDSGEVIIRGGTHFDFDFIPNAGFGATLRGADEIAWYTTAWFDKYVKADPSADARLLTDRWRHDGQEAAIDPGHDGNTFSFYYRSRLDVHRSDGTVFDCEDLRPGCPGLSDDDGFPGAYDYVDVDTRPDTAVLFSSVGVLPGAPRRGGDHGVLPRITLHLSHGVVAKGHLLRLSGVLTQAGHPLARRLVTVTARRPGHPRRVVGRTRTDAHGRWHLALHPRGSAGYVATVLSGDPLKPAISRNREHFSRVI